VKHSAKRRLKRWGEDCLGDGPPLSGVATEHEEISDLSALLIRITKEDKGQASALGKVVGTIRLPCRL
jgi:hypothetical protein